MLKTRAAAVLPALAVVLGSCCTDPIDQTTYFCPFGEMSIEEEVEMGSAYAPIIDVEFDGVYPDEQAFEYLNQLIVEMAGHSIRAGDFQWRFSILNTSMPNAFAVPGGYIYITRGLLAALETEGQFISVMGHELGHVEHRHSHQALGRNVIGGVLVGIINTAESAVTQTEEPGILTSAGAFGTQLFLLRYDRGQESQSDRRGIFYAATMGYDPMEAVKTFEYFQKLEEESGGSQLEWLRTHPLNTTRIEDIRTIVAEQHPELVGRPKESFRPYKSGNDRFEKVVARIRAVQPTYTDYDKAMEKLIEGIQKEEDGKVQAALETFQACAQKIPDEALFATGVGFAHHARGEFPQARSALERAIDLDDRAWPGRKLFRPHFLLALTLFEQKQYAPAKAELLVCDPLNPQNPSVHYYLGRCHEELGDKAQAVAAYRRVLEYDPDPQSAVAQKAKARLDKLGG